MASEEDRASEANQPTLFLSYAHADAKRSEALAAALGQRGYTVWWDNLIEGGASFARSIRAALEAADAVIVLWSRTSIDSDWVADEAAQGRDRRRLVPITLDRMKIDPAVSSAVFVTTCTDCLGFLSFLGLATLVGLGR